MQLAGGHMAMRMAADGNNSMTNADAHTQEVFT